MKENFRISPLCVITALLLIFCLSEKTEAFCTVSTTSGDFGQYDVFSLSPVDATGAISIACNETPSPHVTVQIGPSPNSGLFMPRQLQSSTSADLLTYNLYTDSARTKVWGDGTGGTFTESLTVPKKKTQTLTVYGRIPQSQNVSVGLYTDTLLVTILW